MTAPTPDEAAAPCCGGSGMADYAAVPCPNPQCPVPIEPREEQNQ